MSSFNLSEQADPNKIFLTKFSELEGRFDPYFYTIQFLKVKQLDSISHYPIIAISSLSFLVVDGIHKTPSYGMNGLPFIQVNNIIEGSINFNDNVKKVSKEWKNEVLSRYTPKSGDVLVTKDGTIGVATVVPNEFELFSIFVSVLAIRPKMNLIIPEYLRIVISSSVVQQQILRSTKGAVLSHLLLEEARKLKIPTPPKNIQAEIVEKMDVAYQNKQNKEVQAKKLLSSINTYLLAELGINLPKQTDNSLKARIFTKRLSDIASGRFDCEYYQSKYFNFEESLINTGKYVLLKDLLQMIESGSRPTGGVGQIKNGILSFGGTHVSRDGYIDTSKAKYIPIEYHQKHLITATKINDLLLVKDGATTGKIAIIQKSEHENQNINEHVFLMRLKEGVNSVYLLSYLKSSFGNMQIKREITGATVTGLTKDVVNDLKIPLPPLEKQNQIAEHIGQIRERAKQLQLDAKTGLEKAKQEVETMILGSEV